MSEQSSRDDFAAQIGTKFKIFFDENNPTEAELTDVTERRQNDTFESFALVLVAPDKTAATSGLRKIEHVVLGELAFGLSPFAQNESGTHFEATFCRLLKN